MGINKHNFEQINRLYQLSYQKALASGIHKLDFSIENWYHTLSNVQVKVFEDIKYVGLFLYPIYPIGEHFIDFGHPFKKVGIVVLYKDFQRQERLEAIKYFENKGWTVFTLESKAVFLTAEEFYKNKKRSSGYDYYSDPNISEFLQDYKDQNSQCLVQYIKNNYLIDSIEDFYDEEST